MRISHEAIYQAVYVQGRGALRRDLSACLRTGRALRVPRDRTRARGKKFITPEIMISERPAEVADRAVPGHWEGDLIIGLNRSAIGTLVERTTRFTLLLHLPHMEGHGIGVRPKNGPPLAGHGAEAVRDAITAQMAGLPEQLRRSLTWDQGSELAQHAMLTVQAGLPVYFCDPHSPWQRGTNENTACCASTSPRAPTSPGIAAATSPPSPRPSTPDPERPSVGGHPRRPSTSTYSHSNRPVLLRLLEPKQYTSIRLSEHLALEEIRPSIGSVGDAYDNALMETINGVYKAECIRTTVFHEGPYKTLADVEYATAGWVDWYNERRLHGTLGMVTPVEYEQSHYATLNQEPQPV